MAQEDMDKKPKKLGTFETMKKWWSKITFFVTVAATLIGGYTWIDNKLTSIEQSAVDIGSLKTSNAAIRAEQAAINERITKNVNEAREQIVEEFRQRDEAQRALDSRITAVLNEVRARHGVVTLADDGRRRTVRRAQEESDETAGAYQRAAPANDPLAGLDGL